MALDNLMVVLNGIEVSASVAQQDRLVRAVLLSLFTWRRASAEDVLPGEQRYGWCGDPLSPITDDKFGSRLWLLRRAKILPQTLRNAEGYAREALVWLIEDGVIASMTILSERFGRDGMALSITFYRADGTQILALRFADIWGAVNAI